MNTPKTDKILEDNDFDADNCHDPLVELAKQFAALEGQQDRRGSGGRRPGMSDDYSKEPSQWQQAPPHSMDRPNIYEEPPADTTIWHKADLPVPITMSTVPLDGVIIGKPEETIEEAARNLGVPVTPIEPQEWLKMEDFPADHITWTCPNATIQNFAVSSIVIGSFTLHIEPDGSLRGEGNADGAAQSFLDNVVALHNAKLHELRAGAKRFAEAIAEAGSKYTGDHCGRRECSFCDRYDDKHDPACIVHEASQFLESIKP